MDTLSESQGLPVNPTSFPRNSRQFLWYWLIAVTFYNKNCRHFGFSRISQCVSVSSNDTEPNSAVANYFTYYHLFLNKLVILIDLFYISTNLPPGGLQVLYFIFGVHIDVSTSYSYQIRSYSVVWSDIQVIRVLLLCLSINRSVVSIHMKKYSFHDNSFILAIIIHQ